MNSHLWNKCRTIPSGCKNCFRLFDTSFWIRGNPGIIYVKDEIEQLFYLVVAFVPPVRKQCICI